MAAEVDENAVLDSGRLQVSDCLGNMLAGNRPDRLELDDNPVFYEEVGKVFADPCSVLVKNFQRVLLNDPQPGFPQPMRQRIS